jgi:hypothetical protein
LELEPLKGDNFYTAIWRKIYSKFVFRATVNGKKLPHLGMSNLT